MRQSCARYCQQDDVKGNKGEIRVWRIARDLWVKSRALRRVLFVSIVVCLLYIFCSVSTAHIPNEDPCVVMESHTPVVRNSRLPKIIHQQWPKSKEMPENMRKWFLEWNKHLPNIEHRLWSDEDMHRLVKEDFPWFLKIYEEYPFNIMRVDAARTFILYKFGGLYADMDYEPLADFWNRIPDDRVSLIQSFWRHEMVQNSLMASPPRHGFWNLTWDIMLKRNIERPRKIVYDTLYLTGPDVVETALSLWNSKHAEDSVNILPCDNWQRVSVGHQLQKNEALRRSFLYYLTNSFRVCGSVSDLRCQLGTHHSTTMWGT